MKLKKLNKICALLLVFAMIIQLMPQIALAGGNHNTGDTSSPASTNKTYTEGAVGDSGSYDSNYLYHHIDVKLGAKITTGKYVDGVYSSETYTATVTDVTAKLGNTELTMTQSRNESDYEFQSIGHDFNSWASSAKYLNFNPGTKIMLKGDFTYKVNNVNITTPFNLEVTASESANGQDYNVCPGRYGTINYGFDVILDDSETQQFANNSIMNISKVWKDNNDAAGARPDSISVDIIKTYTENGKPETEKVTTETLTENDKDKADATGNTWSITVSDLANGKYVTGTNEWIPYTYTVVEGDVKDYESSLPETVYEDTDGDKVNDKKTQVITNTYSPNIGSLVINKTVEIDSKDSIQDVNFVVSSEDNTFSENVIIKKGELQESFNDGKAVGSYTLDNLTPGKYTIEEKGAAITDYNCITTPSEPVIVDISKGSSKEVNFTNSYSLITTSYSVEKKWSDEENRDKNRPDSVEVQLYKGDKAIGDVVTLNSSNGFEYTWNNLRKFNNNVEIIYSVKEVNIKEDYAAEYLKKDNGCTIVNKYSPKKTNVNVTILWNDEDDFDKIRPEKVKVVLCNGNDEIESKEVSKDSDGNYTCTFSDLYKYDDGNEIDYIVKQEDLSSIKYTTTTNPVGDNDYTFTNTHTPVKTEVSVKKIWDDDNNRDGIRPATVEVSLYSTCNREKTLVEKRTLSKADVLDKESEWGYTWSNLPTINAGNAITYSIEEISKDDNYTSSVNGYVVTNKHVPATISETTLKKIWEDDNNRDGIRPDSIIVNLYQNDDLYEENIELSKDNNYETVINNLYKYCNGEEVVYSIKEVSSVEGYNFDEEASSNLTIVNVHNINTTSKTVTKQWSGDEDELSKRPENISLQLYADDVEYGEPVIVTESEDNIWSYTWYELPINKKDSVNVPVNYTVKEINIPDGYEANYSEDGNTITNTLKVVEPTNPPVLDPSEEPVLDSSEEPVLDPSEEPVIEPSEEPVLDPSVEPTDEQQDVIISDNDTPNDSTPVISDNNQNTNSPKTGDTSNILYYLVLMILSFMSVILINKKRINMIKAER